MCATLNDFIFQHDLHEAIFGIDQGYEVLDLYYDLKSTHQMQYICKLLVFKLLILFFKKWVYVLLCVLYSISVALAALKRIETNGDASWIRSLPFQVI